jgi:hypothetical protein
MDHMRVALPMTTELSMDGIFSHLREQYRDLEDQHIVRFSPKPTSPDDTEVYVLPVLANLRPGWHFRLTDSPGQWVCWDFGEMRVWPRSYAIQGYKLGSWVLEGSQDGENWEMIDKQELNQDYQGRWSRASFAVSKSPECQFIRLTQLGQNNYSLGLYAIEFFGTILM